MDKNPNLTKDDFYTGGSLKKSKAKGSGGGKHVASKAGEKRYGLPIGTPLGQTKSKKKDDAQTQQSYDTFMSASTAADQKKDAAWLSTDDLNRAGEALFSFKSDNARDQSARDVLVKELADRGIDPHTLGYDGPPVVLNPNPKPDPVAKAAATAQKAQDTATKKADTTTKQAATAADKAAKQSATDAAKAASDADTAAKKKQAEDQAAAHKKIGDDLASGAITESEANDRWAALQKK